MQKKRKSSLREEGGLFKNCRKIEIVMPADYAQGKFKREGDYKGIKYSGFTRDMGTTWTVVLECKSFSDALKLIKNLVTEYNGISKVNMYDYD